MPEKMFLVDGSNHAFRVQFALPPMNATDGFPTRALYGFTTLFAKILRVYRPDYVVVSFDKGKTFRHELFPDYKGHRPDMPEDLALQWPHFGDLVSAFGYPTAHVAGFEADDVLGTLAKRFASPDLQVFLVTGDKDYCQLVDDNIKILDLMKNAEIGAAEVKEQWGVGPELVTDALGLIGDTSDNIPGVAGIGPKKAAQYLADYGDLEGVIAHAKDIGGKTGERIAASAEVARLSKTLATLRLDVPVALSLDELRPKGMQDARLRELFDRWEFGKVARKLLNDRPDVDPSVARAVTTKADLDAAIAEIRTVGRFSLALEMHGADPRKAEVIGISAAWSPEHAVYVPLRQHEPDHIAPDVAIATWKALFEDPSVAKTGHDLKAASHALGRHGIALRGVGGDLMLLDYVLAAHEKSHALDELAQRFLGHTMSAYEQDVSRGEGLFFQQIDLEDAARYAAEPALVALVLDEKLGKRIEPGPRWIYERIELPLVPVLAKMERDGIRVDPSSLLAARQAVAVQADALEVKCYEAAGKRFNLASRHELRDILFDELKLTPGKKVKDGYSTDSSVLENLVEEHPLPGLILEHRRLVKLLSTYLDSLPNYVESDGRIHTRYNQAVAATGRLSSNDPNLQNIPIRTEDGRKIRDAFVPDPGFVFLSADYSQVELRILAHFSQEPALVHSFASGEDIHRRTASEVFGVPLADVTFAHRNAAKAINFGLIYGMSAFRLGQDLQIPQKEAQRYMDEYFGRLPRVKSWLDETRDQAHRDGYVDTLYGRRRIIGDIHSKMWNLRKAAEREAVNSRVQGTAADVIKLAMLAVARLIETQGLRTKMLLQVHDELLLEVPHDELERVRPAVQAAMQDAVKLDVPLAVNTAVGANWNAAHG